MGPLARNGLMDFFMIPVLMTLNKNIFFVMLTLSIYLPTTQIVRSSAFV